MPGFTGPTPKNAMQERKFQGYGVAECGRCGYRHQTDQGMNPENPLFSTSEDGHLVHHCNQDEFYWPKNERERSKLRMSAMTALAEMARWQDVLEKCAPIFSPEHRKKADMIISNLRVDIEHHTSLLISLMEAPHV